MADQNNSQSPEPAAAEFIPPVAELGPNGNPINPPAGDDSPSQDHNLILDTFFGQGEYEPAPNPSEGQPKGSNSEGGQSDVGSLAPPTAAPAANGEEGSPQAGPSSTQQPQGGQAQGGEGAPQTPGPGSQPAPEPQSPPQLSVEDRLRLASAQALEEQNRSLLERIALLERGGQPPQPQGQPGQQPQLGQQPGAGQEQPLRLVVPDDLYNGVMAEDPNVSKQALSVLITAVAHNAVQAALAKVPAIIDERMGQVTQAIEGSRQAQTMEEMYYERFPHHKNELFRPLIQEVVQAKYKAFPNAKWDELMMDAVGSTVNEKLTALGINPVALAGLENQPSGQQNSGQGQPQPKPNGSGKRPQPAPMLDASTRGGVPDNSGDFIASTFG